MVTEHSEDNSEGQMQLSDDDEEDLCRVWDMAMDKVQFVLQSKHGSVGHVLMHFAIKQWLPFVV